MQLTWIRFDDNLFEAERAVLEKNYVLNEFFKKDPRDPEMARKALDFLKKYNKDKDDCYGEI